MMLALGLYIFHHAEDISYVGLTDFHLSIDFKFYFFLHLLIYVDLSPLMCQYDRII